MDVLNGCRVPEADVFRLEHHLQERGGDADVLRHGDTCLETFLTLSSPRQAVQKALAADSLLSVPLLKQVLLSLSPSLPTVRTCS